MLPASKKYFQAGMDEIGECRWGVAVAPAYTRGFLAGLPLPAVRPFLAGFLGGSASGATASSTWRASSFVSFWREGLLERLGML